MRLLNGFISAAYTATEKSPFRKKHSIKADDAPANWLPVFFFVALRSGREMRPDARHLIEIRVLFDVCTKADQSGLP